jgi:hypothetical protein
MNGWERRLLRIGLKGTTCKRTGFCDKEIAKTVESSELRVLRIENSVGTWSIPLNLPAENSQL